MSIADKLQTIAENEQKVYDKGFEIGKREGLRDGLEIGKQVEYDAFWDNYQQNGNRTEYMYGFAGICWNSEKYKPKYPIVLNHRSEFRNSNGMFFLFDRELTKPPIEIHEGDIDFSGNIYTMNQMFQNANVAVVEMNAIPAILKSMTQTFAMTDMNGGHRLHTIKIGVREETTYDVNTFRSVALTNVSFVEGSVIGQNISFQYCDKLTKDSLLNIINVLKDYSGTTTTRTLTLHANAKAILTDSEKAIATQKGWTIA
jgi:hypothetical protein